jgi:hypothetical protein
MRPRLMIVANCGSAPSVGRSTFISDGSSGLDRSENTPNALVAAIA